MTNRDDGAVEAVFEGESATVDELIEFVRAGPGRAAVEGLEVSGEPSEGLTGFRIV